MPLSGARFGDGAGAGTTVASLSSLIGNRKQYRWISFNAPAANVGAVSISTTAAGGGAGTIYSFVAATAGTWTIGPSLNNTPAGEAFTIDPSTLYLIGTHVNDICYISYIS